MRQPRQIAWVLFKTAIFTAIAPYFVGLRFPDYPRRVYSAPADTGLGASLPRAILGNAFLLLGAGIYPWCAWDFALKGMGTPAPLDAPRTLVVTGLYRFVRNPMYLGVACLIFSQAVMGGSVPVLVYLCFVIACFHLFILLYEEPHLRRVFGEQYEDYCRKVRRWIPRPSAYRPPAT